MRKARDQNFVTPPLGIKIFHDPPYPTLRNFMTPPYFFVAPPPAVNNDNHLRTKLVIEHVKYGEILDFKLKKSKIWYFENVFTWNSKCLRNTSMNAAIVSVIWCS